VNGRRCEDGAIIREDGHPAAVVRRMWATGPTSVPTAPPDPAAIAEVMRRHGLTVALIRAPFTGANT
jgi:hypothetical protein